jgi:hypothetical protein
LERIDIPPVTGHQKHWARSCLRGRINGADRYAHNGDHRDRHDQQQDETAGTEYQTASLRR